MSDQAKESKLADLLFDQVAEGYIGALEQARPLLNQVGVRDVPVSLEDLGVTRPQVQALAAAVLSGARDAALKQQVSAAAAGIGAVVGGVVVGALGTVVGPPFGTVIGASAGSAVGGALTLLLVQLFENAVVRFVDEDLGA